MENSLLGRYTFNSHECHIDHQSQICLYKGRVKHHILKRTIKFKPYHRHAYHGSVDMSITLQNMEKEIKMLKNAPPPAPLNRELLSVRSNTVLSNMVNMLKSDSIFMFIKNSEVLVWETFCYIDDYNVKQIKFQYIHM